MINNADIPKLKDIEIAYNMIKPYIHETPVLEASSLNDLVGANLYFKCENFQKGGAYKARAACYNILCLNEKEKQAGVCSHSSGNHGSCLAKMAQKFNVKCYIVMPQNSPLVKIEATKSYEGNVTLSGNTQKEREESLLQIQEQYGAIYIPPFDSWRTIIGAGTTAYEFLRQQQQLDYILVPLGGGGLCGGTLIASSEHTNIKIIGVEPELASDGLQSLKEGIIQEQMPIKTIADGLRTKLGIRPFEIIKSQITDIWVVSEEEIIGATILIWQRLKIFVETSSATVLAGAIKYKDQLKGKNVGLIISGGNVDLKILSQYF